MKLSVNQRAVLRTLKIFGLSTAVAAGIGVFFTYIVPFITREVFGYIFSIGLITFFVKLVFDVSKAKIEFDDSIKELAEKNNVKID